MNSLDALKANTSYEKYDRKLEAVETLRNDLSQNPENVSSPAPHEQVLKELENEALIGIQEGMDDLKAGRITPEDEFFEEFFSKYDISR